MITDIEFQNRRDVMRLAPWLDMALFRTQMKVLLQSQLDGQSGFLVGYVTEYREDVKSFCDGAHARIPRCTSAIEFIRRKIVRIFPESADGQLVDATELICTHIMQRALWRVRERGHESQETAGEGPHRTNPLLERSYDDEDEDEEDGYDDYDEDEEG